MKKKKQLLLGGIIFLSLINILFLSLLVSPSESEQRQNKIIPTSAPIIDLTKKQMSFEQLQSYFKNVSDSKGAVYSYDVLRNALLPSNTDIHLLGHAIGDKLYEQKGVDGMQYCTHEFRNACSHSIVVALFQARGEAALSMISSTCRKAPGGSGAYTMCFHGLGHGVLSSTGYDLEKTIELCKKTGTKEFNNQEFPQCVGGAIMEIISGGGHDRELWLQRRANYLNPSQPLYSCATLVPEEAKTLCYMYISPFLLEATGADIASPNKDDFLNAFTLCSTIPEKDKEHLTTCYGGFGKEFIVLAQDRDIRKTENMTNKQLSQVEEWCVLARNSEGIEACIESAMQSLFWGGENSYSVAVNFCNILREKDYQKNCFNNLIQAVSVYIQDSAYKKEFCSSLPSQMLNPCQERLL